MKFWLNTEHGERASKVVGSLWAIFRTDLCIKIEQTPQVTGDDQTWDSDMILQIQSIIGFLWISTG